MGLELIAILIGVFSLLIIGAYFLLKDYTQEEEVDDWWREHELTRNGRDQYTRALRGRRRW